MPTVEDPKTPVSPKVTASTMTGAATLVVLYLLGQIGFVASMPEEIKFALLILITGGFTFLAGWLKKDPLRRGYVGEHERGRDEMGKVTVYYVAAVLVIAVCAIWLLTWLLGRV